LPGTRPATDGFCGLKGDNVQKTDKEWKQILTPAQYDVLRLQGTERPFTGAYVHTHDDGTYHCAGCGASLFSSGTKFDSGSGWPSFTDVIEKGNVELLDDNSLLMRRTEVRCKECGGHLGHVFPDGPGPTGLRYCINSAALSFEASGDRQASNTGET
jgi:peptide-methionine (R)-S-oxide reductase